MKRHTKPTRSKPAATRVVRRSVALPRRLVEQVSEAAPEYLRGNVNAIVRTALEEYVRNREREAFEREMEAMAADPQVRAVNEEIFRSFASLDGEALPPP
jgi:metal-responsive CopG/Arc/MetJ family transcriptional regulator